MSDDKKLTPKEVDMLLDAYNKGKKEGEGFFYQLGKIAMSLLKIFNS